MTYSARNPSTSVAKKSSPNSSDIRIKLPIRSPDLYTSNAGTPVLAYRTKK